MRYNFSFDVWELPKRRSKLRNATICPFNCKIQWKNNWQWILSWIKKDTSYFSGVIFIYPVHGNICELIDAKNIHDGRIIELREYIFYRKQQLTRNRIEFPSRIRENHWSDKRNPDIFMSFSIWDSTKLVMEKKEKLMRMVGERKASPINFFFQLSTERTRLWLSRIQHT